MKTFESHNYEDCTGDDVQIDTHDTHTKICVYHSSGAWPCDNPETLRAIAAQLIRGAEHLEAAKCQ
jgi:hypothetical protein